MDQNKSTIMAAALVVSVTIGGFFYKSAENNRNEILQQQQLSSAIQAISNVKPEMQSIYIISLGGYGNKALPVLLKLLSLPAESPAASGAGIALQVMGNDGLSEIMKIAGDNSAPVELRNAAIAGLGKIGGNKSKETLLKIAQNKKEVYLVRNQALKSLASYSNLDLIAPLFALLGEEDKNAGTFYQSLLDLLFDIAGRASAIKEPELSSADKSALTGGLTGKKADIRFFAVKILGDMKSKENLAAIESISKSDSVDYVKTEAEAAVKRIKGEPAVLAK